MINILCSEFYIPVQYAILQANTMFNTMYVYIELMSISFFPASELSTRIVNFYRKHKTKFKD